MKIRSFPLLALTAALAGGFFMPRGEGEDTPPANTQTPPADNRLTEAEWEARVRTREAQTSQAELIRRLAQVERQNADLQASQVPRGGRALTRDEARAYDAYVALGTPEDVQSRLTERDTYAQHGTPDEVKTKLEAGQTAVTTLAERDRTDAIRAAASAVQFKDTVLGDRLTADGLELLPLEKVVRDGKEVQVAYVKDAQGVKHELGEYAKAKWNDYLPALQVTATTQMPGPAFPRQDAPRTPSSSSSGGGGWVQTALAQSSQGGDYKDPLQPK
ncbi:MAG: hypothetical protein Q4C89_00930 [Deinococcus sp.]|uniref:hypothetical protein n=1 Tax=Deinococcus sp. TaxID=47478 RepID=UPI0026DC7082|nr:hypothetical protein [Deinococcus sp.]MDO4244573.1 hypothetical protein [Deinococcus sp.]